ncbi:hypothetical protein JCM17380_18600 [Desulfosporosinus burensis]
MKKTKKALATLAIAGMALSMVPFNAFATTTVPTRLAGNTAAQTAVAIADQTGWTGTAILASSVSYAMVDALTAGPLASYLKAPILLTDGGNTLDADTKAELTKLAVKTVYVTSGTAVIKQSVLDELAAMGITVVPLGGVDKFETSVNIAEKMVGVTKVAVATGAQVQDALSIASIASAANQPILLTNKDALPASVAAYLAANPGITASDVIGGTGVISDAVKATLPSATRHAGNTAYDTNNQVIQDFASSLTFSSVFVANGSTGIDALAGAPLAAKTKSAIVLTDGAATAAATFVNSKLTASSVVTALGGTAVVPASTLAGVAYQAPATLAVTSVSAINAKEILVSFNKVVNETSAETVSYYEFKSSDAATQAAGIAEVVLQDDKKSAIVRLTSAMANGDSYKVNIEDVIDEATYQTVTKYSDSFKIFTDSVVPAVVKAELRSNNKVRITFNEPVIQAGASIKVDGVTVAVDSVSTTTGKYYMESAVISGDFIKAGDHSVVVYNVTDAQRASAKTLVMGTASYTVGTDTTAPYVVGLAAKDSDTFKIIFSENVQTLTDTEVVVKKGAYVFPGARVGGYSVDPDDTSGNTVLVDITPADVDNPLYADGENNVTISVQVKGYKDAAVLLGTEYNGSVTLTKDASAPYVVSEALNVTRTDAGPLYYLVVKFNETIGTVDASKFTVVKDGVYVTVAGVAVNGSDSKKVDIQIGSALTDGNYTVTLDAGAVKDTSSNKNAAATTTASHKAVSGTALVVAVSPDAVLDANEVLVANNVVRINYGEKMTSTAIDLANYTLDGAAMPAGTSIGFEDAGKTTVKMTLPSGTVAVDGTKLFSISKNVTSDAGKVVMTSAEAQIQLVTAGFVDNVKPVLASAKLVVADGATTTSTITVKFNEGLAAIAASNANIYDDFIIKVAGVKVAANDNVAVNAGDKEITLTLASAINVNQTVTVQIASSADVTIDVSDDSSLLNKVTEGTIVTATK